MMTDASFSSNSLRIQRGRNPSSSQAPRTSTYHDEGSLRLPSGPPGNGAGHSLRSVSSRFSLSEHFAATRSLYEFGFDDASSYAAPSVLVPDATTTIVEGGDGILTEEDEERLEVEKLLEGEFHDILCLSREEGILTKEDIRRAYHRMFLLFYPETYPIAMQEIARRQFERAQEGFEVLIDEQRRLAGEGGEPEGKEDITRAIQSRTDVGIRMDASKGIKGYKPLDFAVGHASSMRLPALKAPLNTSLSPLGLTTTPPSLSLSSSIYGIIPTMSAMPIHLLSSPDQPLRPETSPRHRLLQLVESKLSPVIRARLSHYITNNSDTAPNWLGTEAEYGLDILPDLAPSLNLFHHLELSPDARSSTVFETSIRSRSWWSSIDDQATPPRLAVGVHHPLSFGDAFIRVDSGDWDLAPESYRFLASASIPEASSISYAEFPLKIAPTLEIGFTSPSDTPSRSWIEALETGQPDFSALPGDTQSANVGIWTASTTVQPLNSLTTSIRYTSPSLAILSSSSLEVDLSTSTYHPSVISLRHLIPFTTSTNLGLELSATRFSTHISLHISRSKQRFSLPLFFPPVEHLRPQTLFLASAIPFLALAAYKFLKRSRRATKQEPQDEKRIVLDTSSPVVQAAIALRREEADHLTGLLAHPIATRQKHHASQGNLVILSAKFGVADSSSSGPSITVNSKSSSGPVLTFDPDEEIADVTVALAALVDEQTGGLWIPAGVRKGCVPGFWDPAPGREKLLLVRYSWRGKEDIASVRGDNELVLPPPQ
ncbi:hypothetical protein CC79DRAFT_1355254 [Sarocladium strictum]